MDKEKNKLSLVEAIKDKLRKEDKAVASCINFSKSDEDIISSMEYVKLLKFSKPEENDD